MLSVIATQHRARGTAAAGYTMIEVLVALVVLAIGILGLANLMSKMHQSETEAYQRAQALMLLQEMSNRVAIAGAPLGLSTATAADVTAFEASYVTGTTAPLGTGDLFGTNCGGQTGANYDQCTWSVGLKGSSEAAGGASVGAMIGARGCVEVLQSVIPPPALNCQQGVYRVSVVWQGLTQTATQASLGCGSGSYGNDNLRRIVTSVVTIPVPSC